jgi:thioredoxin reductase
LRQAATGLPRAQGRGASPPNPSIRVRSSHSPHRGGLARVLGRARRRVAVIDAGAPRNAPAAYMHGFLSRDGMPPADLLAQGRDEVTGYGVELVSGQVLGIEPGFVVRVAGGRTVTARRILVATGAGS